MPVAPVVMKKARRVALKPAATPAQRPPSERFVGRQAALDVLRERFEAARAGAGTVVLVGGTAGIGKSRLAAEYAAFARALGGRAGTGICVGYAPAPLAPLLEALRAAGVGLARPDRDWYDLEKRRAFDDLASTFAVEGLGEPLVIVLEDLHDADESTRDFLRFVRPSLADLPIVLVGTYRDDELRPGHPFARVVSELASAEGVRHVFLEPLDEREMAALLRNAAGANRADLAERLREIARLAEGNPFVARELLKDGARPGNATRSGRHVPPSLAGSVLERLGRLAAEDRRIVIAATAIGREFDSGSLGRIADAAPEAVRSALRAGIEWQLVVEAGAPGRYAFRHALTHRIVESELLAEESRSLHLAIARDVERDPNAGARAFELAHHLFEAGETARASGVAEAAGDRAVARGRDGDAADAYALARAALAAAGGDPDAARMAHLCLSLAAARTRDARFDEAEEPARAAYDAFSRADDAPAIARAARLCAALAAAENDAPASLAFAKVAIARGRDTTPEERRLATLQCALSTALGGDTATARPALAAASEPFASDTRAAFDACALAACTTALLGLRLECEGFERSASAIAATLGIPSARAALAIDLELFRAIAWLRAGDPASAWAAYVRANAKVTDRTHVARRMLRIGGEIAAAFERQHLASEGVAAYRYLDDLESAARLEAASRNRQGRTKDELTKREAEVARHVAAGRTNREIATDVFLSERTVEDHVGAVLRKLGLRNRAELAAHMARIG